VLLVCKYSQETSVQFVPEFSASIISQEVYKFLLAVLRLCNFKEYVSKTKPIDVTCSTQWHVSQQAHNTLPEYIPERESVPKVLIKQVRKGI